MATKKKQLERLSAYVFRFWTDADFRDRARRDTVGSLREMEIEPVRGFTYQLVEETATSRVIVMPAKPTVVTVDLRSAATFAIDHTDATGVETDGPVHVPKKAKKSIASRGAGSKSSTPSKRGKKRP